MFRAPPRSLQLLCTFHELIELRVRHLFGIAIEKLFKRLKLRDFWFGPRLFC